MKEITEKDMRHAVNLAYNTCRRYRKDCNEDVIQEAFVGLCRSAKKYDPKKGDWEKYYRWQVIMEVKRYILPYGNYAGGKISFKKCIYHQKRGIHYQFINREFFENSNRGNKPTDFIFKWEPKVTGVLPDKLYYKPTQENIAIANDLASKTTAILPDKYKTISRLFFQGKPQKEMVKKTGISQQEVSRRTLFIRKKLKSIAVLGERDDNR